MWVNEIICQVPGLFPNMLNETYNKWVSPPCSEMGFSKQRGSQHFFWQRKFLSLMDDISISDPCVYEDAYMGMNLYGIHLFFDNI